MNEHYVSCPCRKSVCYKLRYSRRRSYTHAEIGESLHPDGYIPMAKWVAEKVAKFVDGKTESVYVH